MEKSFKFLIPTDGSKLAKVAFTTTIYELMGSDDSIEIVNIYDRKKTWLP